MLRSRGYNGYRNIWRGNGTTLHKFTSCCTSPSFVFGAKFATPRMALGTAHAPRACRVKCSPKGPKIMFEYLPTCKTLHCVRTACTAFPLFNLCDNMFHHIDKIWLEFVAVAKGLEHNKDNIYKERDAMCITAPLHHCMQAG